MLKTTKVDEIVNNLYESATISWIWDGGFYVTLGEPKQAESWAFPSIGEAVEWLRNHAIAH